MAHAIPSLTDLDCLATVLTIDGISACDLISRLRGLPPAEAEFAATHDEACWQCLSQLLNLPSDTDRRNLASLPFSLGGCVGWALDLGQFNSGQWGLLFDFGQKKSHGDLFDLWGREGWAREEWGPEGGGPGRVGPRREEGWGPKGVPL